MRRRAAWVWIGAAAMGCAEEDSPEETTGGQTGGQGGDGGAMVDTPLAGTVTRYTYAFDLASAMATSALEVDVETPGNCFEIADELAPGETKMNGAPASIVHDGALLTACSPEVLAETWTLETTQAVPELTHLANLDVGFSRRPSQGGGTFSYLLSWVGGCDHFGPCDDRTDALVELRFDVTHPTDATVLCPGTLTAGTSSTSCVLDAAPTYSGFALVADTGWTRTPFVEAAGVEVAFYEAPNGLLQPALEPASVTAFLEWITDTLGPYPYGPEMRVAAGPTAWLGFEHPANIVLRDDLPLLNVSYADPTMHVLMHEIAHQWAGDRTTLASVADFVWKEAIAEYLAYVFEDEQGAAGVADTTRRYWDEVSPAATHHPRPTDEPTPAVESFYGDVYGPGPMVLFVQLEPWLGRSNILGAIAAFLAEPGARSVADLQLALEDAGGVDLEAYFETWVFGSGAPAWPELLVSSRAGTGDVTVTVAMGDDVPRGCVVEVDVIGATQTATASIDFGAAPTMASASVTIPFGEPVTQLVVDPRHRVIDVGGPTVAARPIVWPL